MDHGQEPVLGDEISDSTGISNRTALVALILLVPAPSIGTAAAMLVDVTAGPVGQSLYIAGKIWLALLPLLWLRFFMKRRLSWSPAKRGGFVTAAVLGIAISVVIAGVYIVLGSKLVDPEMVRGQAAESGIDNKLVYLGFGLYLCMINSLLEEYVWRWFVFRHCETLVGGPVAIALSAALFTVHHVLALSAQFDWLVTALASAGVFIGGAVWSWCYLRFRSIWPGYVSHLIVDVTILIIGWHLLFGF